MTSTLLGALSVLVSVPLGWTLHELTHLLAARLLGVPARWHTSLRHSMYVEYRATSWLRDRLICLAPFLVGIAAAAGILLTIGVPGHGLELLAVTAGWAFFTLDISTEDLQVATGD